MNFSLIDLHTHTIHSDGELSVWGLINKAIDNKVQSLSITDHDTVNGVIEAQRIVKEHNFHIKIVPGIEISCYDYDTKLNVHLLGYFIDVTNQSFLGFVDSLQKIRLERNSLLLKELVAHRINLIDPVIWQEIDLRTISRLNIAEMIVTKGYAKSIQEVFSHLLSDRSIKNIPSTKISIQESIKAINDCGGIALIAHPGLLPLSQERLFQRLSDYKKYGLKGIEVFHPSHSAQLQSNLLQYCQENQLEYSHGSDFHGKNKPFCILGEIYCKISNFSASFVSSFLQQEINML